MMPVILLTVPIWALFWKISSFLNTRYGGAEEQAHDPAFNHLRDRARGAGRRRGRGHSRGQGRSPAAREKDQSTQDVDDGGGARHAGRRGLVRLRLLDRR